MNVASYICGTEREKTNSGATLNDLGMSLCDPVFFEKKKIRDYATPPTPLCNIIYNCNCVASDYAKSYLGATHNANMWVAVDIDALQLCHFFSPLNSVMVA